jgi:hypothetical protein
MAFMDFLREHRHGATHEELTDALRDLTLAVAEERRGGKLVLTITVKPLAKGDGMEVHADVKLAAPAPIPGVSIFYPTPEGQLVRQDPRQQSMELKEIGPAEAHRGLA